jgi:putative ABC transport system permease protein
MSEYVRLSVGLLALLIIAVAVSYVAGVRRERDLVTASVRAVLQLALVAAALRGVFAAPWLSAVVVAVMFSVATWTAARRLQMIPGSGRAVVYSCAAGSGVAIALIVALPTLDRNVRTFVAVSGIVLGGTMTAATLAGRHLDEGLRRRRDEIEAWLSVGASSRQAVREIARRAASEALVPALDQTRTVGLVTLPGAFVGALLGGASAVGAARFQIAVLVGLLCAQTITVALLMYLLGAPATIPAAETDGARR